MNRTNAVRDILTAWSCSDPASLITMKAWEMTTKMEGVADEASKMKEVESGKPLQYLEFEACFCAYDRCKDGNVYVRAFGTI